MKILSLFKKPKYEFRIQEATNTGMSKQIMENLQNDGWELAGQIGIKQAQIYNIECMLIPLKKKIK